MRHLGGRLLDFQLDALELGRDLALVDGGRGLPGVKAVSDAATGRLRLTLLVMLLFIHGAGCGP